MLTQCQSDELAYLLRKVYLSGDDNESTAVTGLFDHLVLRKGKDSYESLLLYLRFYGAVYLLPPLVGIIDKLKPGRYIDIGCGNGWLGGGLSGLTGKKALFFDKRKLFDEVVIADVETDSGINIIKDSLRESDVLLMCNFLHCITNPVQVVREFSEHKMVIIEYTPVDSNHLTAYAKQIKSLGAEFVDPVEVFLKAGIPHKEFNAYRLSSYIVLVNSPY